LRAHSEIAGCSQGTESPQCNSGQQCVSGCVAERSGSAAYARRRATTGVKTGNDGAVLPDDPSVGVDVEPPLCVKQSGQDTAGIEGRNERRQPKFSSTELVWALTGCGGIICGNGCRGGCGVDTLSARHLPDCLALLQASVGMQLRELLLLHRNLEH